MRTVSITQPSGIHANQKFTFLGKIRASAFAIKTVSLYQSLPYKLNMNLS